MKLRIGINGFGRIGRAIFRNNLEKDYFDIVCINDINPDINNIAYLLKYDTTYGKLTSKIKIAGNKMIVDGNHIKISNEKNIEDVNWKGSDVDIIVDSSGVEENLSKARSLKNHVDYCKIQAFFHKCFVCLCH